MSTAVVVAKRVPGQWHRGGIRRRLISGSGEQYVSRELWRHRMGCVEPYQKRERERRGRQRDEASEDETLNPKSGQTTSAAQM